MTLCRASHASDRVNHLGVPDQFKNILIAGTVAIGIGIGQIKAHSLSMGKNQFALAPAIGQWGNQRAGIDRILLRGLRRKDRGHVQKLRKGRDQKVRRASDKNHLVSSLSMGVQFCPTLYGQFADHVGLTKLPGMRFNIGGRLACQIHFSLSERVQREGGRMPRQPGNGSTQFAPSHQAAPPQKPKESYFAGLSRQERVVNVEQCRDGPLYPSLDGVIERGREAVMIWHNVGGPGEHEPPDSTGASID